MADSDTPATPTWQNTIRDLFTQYERIQMIQVHIDLDLGSYESVRANANSILDAVSPGSALRMPLQVAPWTAEQIATFKAWIDTDCPYGPPVQPPAPSGQAFAGFVAVSQALTGFSDLDSNISAKMLAQKYMDRLRTEVLFGDSLIDALISTYDAIESDAPPDDSREGWIHEQIANRIMADATLGPFARTVILAWYMGSINGVLGTPEDNQYIHGLMWQAIKAHPQGFTNEAPSVEVLKNNEGYGPDNPAYWSETPVGGKYTGLRLPILSIEGQSS